MTHTKAWRNFRRMQASALAFAVLVYAGALARAWPSLPGPSQLRWPVLIFFPAFFAMAVLAAALQAPPLRRRLKRYVWLSFVAGFGQTVPSVLTGLAVLAAAAGLVYFDIEAGVQGGRSPAGSFSALGAGIGVLAAQLLLTYALEREPKVREIIEEKDGA